MIYYQKSNVPICIEYKFEYFIEYVCYTVVHEQYAFFTNKIKYSNSC